MFTKYQYNYNNQRHANPHCHGYSKMVIMLMVTRACQSIHFLNGHDGKENNGNLGRHVNDKS